jgi:hypothetical protein
MKTFDELQEGLNDSQMIGTLRYLLEDLVETMQKEKDLSANAKRKVKYAADRLKELKK